MSASTLTARGRWAAQRDMVDTCTIKHQTSVSTDPTNGVVTPTYTTVYTGACKVGVATASQQEVAEAHLATLAPTISVPITVTGVVETDLVTITTCALDPDLVGKAFRVQGPMHKTYGTARRLQCIEATS